MNKMLISSKLVTLAEIEAVFTKTEMNIEWNINFFSK